MFLKKNIVYKMTLTFDNHCALFADIQARRFRWHMTGYLLILMF
jgi:hypothetical protein